MKKCIVCDICKKVISYEGYRIQKKRPFRVIKQDLDWELDVFGADIDICPECWKSLTDFIKDRVNLKKA